MANINLSTEDVRQKADLSVGQGGTAILIIILVVILAVYGAELFWNQRMTKETDAIQAEMNSKYKNLSKGNPITVVDFQNRLAAAKEAINKGRDTRENLMEIEKAVIPGVYLKGYDFDQKSGSIALNCIGDNYNLVAKQILSFKKSAYFASASGGESVFMSEIGKVSFKVNLILK